MEPVHPVQMSIYQSNTQREDSSWLHFEDEPKVVSEGLAQFGVISSLLMKLPLKIFKDKIRYLSDVKDKKRNFI